MLFSLRLRRDHRPFSSLAAPGLIETVNPAIVSLHVLVTPQVWFPAFPLGPGPAHVAESLRPESRFIPFLQIN